MSCLDVLKVDNAVFATFLHYIPLCEVVESNSAFMNVPYFLQNFGSAIPSDETGKKYDIIYGNKPICQGERREKIIHVVPAVFEDDTSDFSCFHTLQLFSLEQPEKLRNVDSLQRLKVIGIYRGLSSK